MDVEIRPDELPPAVPNDVATVNASISYYFTGILGELRRGLDALHLAIVRGEDRRGTLMYMVALMFGSQRFLATFRKDAEQHVRWRMHEMNNRFMVISGTCQLLMGPRVYPANEVTSMLEGLTHALIDLERIVDHRSGFQDVEVIELVGFAHDVIRDVQSWMMGSTVRFTSECREVSAHLAKTGFEMTLSNLLTNSAQAEAKQIEVILTTVFLDEVACADQGSWNWRPRGVGMYALLEVTDDGNGMDRVTRRSIFSKEISTKDGGWGVGLYGVGKFLASCGGGARVESSPVGGTTIRLYFPLAVS